MGDFLIRLNTDYSKYDSKSSTPQGIAIISLAPVEYINNQYISTANRF